MSIRIRTRTANGQQSDELYGTEAAGLKALQQNLNAHRSGGNTVTRNGDTYVVTNHKGEFVQIHRRAVGVAVPVSIHGLWARWALGALTVLSALVAGSARGQTPERATIRLICSFDYTLDGKDATRSETSGDELVTVVYRRDNGDAVIRIQDFGGAFSGRVTDDEIVGDTEDDIGGMRIQQSIKINRFTGSYTKTFRPGGSSGLIHFGACRKVDEPKF